MAEEEALGDRDPALHPHREQVLRQTSGLAGLVFGFVIAFVGPDAKTATETERWLVFLAVVMLLLAVVSGLVREWALATARVPGSGEEKTVSRLLSFEVAAAVAIPCFFVLGMLALLAYAAAILVIGDAATA